MAAQAEPEPLPISPEAVAEATPKATRGGGIPCPRCQSDISNVVRTRKRKTGLQRVRRCECGHKFITSESVDAIHSASLATDSESLKRALTAFGRRLESLSSDPT